MKKLKMSKRSKAALDKAIKHWEVDVKENNEYPRSDNCALCGLYIKNECQGCPVCIKAKQSECYRTPYYEYTAVLDLLGIASDIAQRKRLAQKEIDFLKTCYY